MIDNATATLPEIVFETLRIFDALSFDALRIIEGLERVEQENCCECIVFCKDTTKYLAKRENILPSEEDQDYQALEDQIRNLCSHMAELGDGTLTCSSRDKYLGVKHGS